MGQAATKMIFKRIEPSPAISNWVECFWIIENDDPKQVTQKIIPDGFPEIIFHFGDPYEINLNGHWEHQAMNLLAGQIKKFFWLRNTGKSNIFGIKLRPSSPARWLGLKMDQLTDRVVDIATLDNRLLTLFQDRLRVPSTFKDKIEIVSKYFSYMKHPMHPTEKAIKIIFEKHGMNTVSELVHELRVSERQVQRLFKQYIGLSPKFYSRVIRFSNIFKLKENGDPSWLDLTHGSGFADQSHFIRNFKSFAGEDPSQYGFNEQNIANFFMRKQ